MTKHAEEAALNEREAGRKLASTRRDFLIGGGIGVLALAEPAMAMMAQSAAPAGPPGHARMSPSFSRIDLQK